MYKIKFFIFFMLLFSFNVKAADRNEQIKRDGECEGAGIALISQGEPLSAMSEYSTRNYMNILNNSKYKKLTDKWMPTRDACQASSIKKGGNINDINNCLAKAIHEPEALLFMKSFNELFNRTLVLYESNNPGDRVIARTLANSACLRLPVQ